MNENPKGALMILAAAAGFGTLAIFGKMAGAAGLDTSTLLLFRFVLGGSILWFVFGALGRLRPLRGRSLWMALSLGGLYGIMTGMFFWGLEFLSASLAAIILYSYPVYVFMLSTAFLDERLTRAKLLALISVGIGIRLTVGPNPGDVDALGVVLVLVSSIGYAVYTTGSRAALRSVDSASFVAVALVATTLSMIPFGLLFGGLSIPSGIEQWTLIAGIGIVGTAIPILLFVSGLERIEAGHASIIGTSEPVVTVLLGIGLLGEPMTAGLVAGGTLILGGAVIVQRNSRNSGVIMH